MSLIQVVLIAIAIILYPLDGIDFRAQLGLAWVHSLQMLVLVVLVIQVGSMEAYRLQWVHQQMVICVSMAMVLYVTDNFRPTILWSLTVVTIMFSFYQHYLPVFTDIVLHESYLTTIEKNFMLLFYLHWCI